MSDTATRRPPGRSLREAGKAVLVLAVGLVGLALLMSFFISVTPAPSKSDQAHQDLRNLESAVELYVRRKGRLPATGEGFRALVEAGTLETLPVDPWGHPYSFTLSEDRQAEVSSLGADGEPGGEGSDADFVRRFKLQLPSP